MEVTPEHTGAKEFRIYFTYMKDWMLSATADLPPA